jgi:hypothetical protein
MIDEKDLFETNAEMQEKYSDNFQTPPKRKRKYSQKIRQYRIAEKFDKILRASNSIKEELAELKNLMDDDDVFFLSSRKLNIDQDSPIVIK